MTKETAILSRLNAVRLLVVILIGIGYASTMAVGPHAKEWLHSFGYDPSWFGIKVLFFLSGWLAWRSLDQGRTGLTFLASRARRILPWVAGYTLFVVAILYPLFCNHDADVVKGTAELALYFAKTVLLIDPGGPMPGALDDALYACLLQGTIWTLRWGLVAYLGLLILFALGVRRRFVLAALFVLALIVHLAAFWWTVRTESALLEPVLPGLRLAYPFLLGALAYAMKSTLPRTGRGWGLIAIIAFALAGLHYFGLRWTPLIEVVATIGWCAVAMALLHGRISVLQNWPNLVLPAYLGVWPTAQTLVAINTDIAVPTLVAATLLIVLGVALILRLAADLVFGSVHRRVQTA